MNERVQQTLQQIATPTPCSIRSTERSSPANTKQQRQLILQAGRYLVYEVNRKWECVGKQMQLIKRRTSLPTSTHSL
jgi:hypothetical protein